MKLGVFSDPLSGLSRVEFLDLAASLGISHVEFGTGCWSSSPHLDLDGLLDSGSARDRLLGELKDRNLCISALNCSGNPLHPGPNGKLHDQIARKTVALAEHLDVERVVMMSGCPGAPGDAWPNWITVSWPPEATEVLEWQWREVVIPYWRQFGQEASDRGRRICLELHGYQNVYSADTFLRLRDAVGRVVGVNFDPSHLFWMGADPLVAVRALGDTIYHVHAKDTKIEASNAARNGLLDGQPVLPIAPRSWNFVSVGKGHDAAFWKQFVSTLRDHGYDDVISVEHEDYSVPSTAEVVSAIKHCLQLLRA